MRNKLLTYNINDVWLTIRTPHRLTLIGVTRSHPWKRLYLVQFLDTQGLLNPMLWYKIFHASRLLFDTTRGLVSQLTQANPLHDMSIQVQLNCIVLVMDNLIQF